MMGSPGPGYKTPPDPFGCVLACEGLTQKLVRCLVAGDQQALCALQQALNLVVGKTILGWTCPRVLWSLWAVSCTKPYHGVIRWMWGHLYSLQELSLHVAWWPRGLGRRMAACRSHSWLHTMPGPGRCRRRRTTGNKILIWIVFDESLMQRDWWIEGQSYFCKKTELQCFAKRSRSWDFEEHSSVLYSSGNTVSHSFQWIIAPCSTLWYFHIIYINLWTQLSCTG